MYISILNTDSNTQLTDINNSQKCVLKEEKKITEKNKYKLLSEFCHIYITLDEYIKIFLLPPFNLLKEVERISSLIICFNFTYTEDKIIEFLNSLPEKISSISVEFIKLCQILFSENFDAIDMVNLKDSFFLSTKFESQVIPNDEGIFIDFSTFLAVVIIQHITKLQLLVNKEIPKKFDTSIEIPIIEEMNLIVNSLQGEKEVRIKIKPLLNKIQLLLQECKLSKTEFKNKFDFFIDNLKKLDGLKENKGKLINSFLHLLDTIKEELPTTKCVDFYGMDFVSKYDFYDLLKKIGTVLIKINQDDTYKELIEKKIIEIEPFLDVNDRELSLVRREEEVRIKIIPLLNKILLLLERCNLSETNFKNKFVIFMNNFKKLDVLEKNKDNLFNSFLDILDTIKDKLPTPKCVDFYGMDDVSKYDFYDLLKKIGTVLIKINKDDTYKNKIEIKIKEIKPFLSTSDKVLSFVKKKIFKPNVESVEKPEDKIKKSIDELHQLIEYCIPIQSNKFIIHWRSFLKNLNTSNITKNDINNFDFVYKSVDDLFVIFEPTVESVEKPEDKIKKSKDKYGCTKGFSKKDFSKEELKTKLTEIGNLLLSNISELA